MTPQPHDPRWCVYGTYLYAAFSAAHSQRTNLCPLTCAEEYLFYLGNDGVLEYLYGYHPVSIACWIYDCCIGLGKGGGVKALVLQESVLKQRTRKYFFSLFSCQSNSSYFIVITVVIIVYYIVYFLSRHRGSLLSESPPRIVSKIADMYLEEFLLSSNSGTSASSVKYEGHAKSELRPALTSPHKGILAPCPHCTIRAKMRVR